MTAECCLSLPVTILYSRTEISHSGCCLEHQLINYYLRHRQVKTPKYNCPQGLYSDTTMDEMISGSGGVE